VNKLKSKKEILFAFMLAVLSASLLIRFVYTQWIRPAPFYVYYDPEMAYYFSSLSYLQGAPLVYIDHPGTPVEILGALIFLSTYPVTRWLGLPFVDFNISQPEIFLSIAHALITLACISTLVFLALTFWRGQARSNALLASSLAVMYFTIHPLALNLAVSWSHNAFNFPLGTLVLIFLYRAVQEERPIPLREIILMGIATGLLTAITIYLATWVIGVGLTFFILALLRKEGFPKAVLAAFLTGISSLIGFCLATLPIASLYPQFAKWVLNLLIHQGRYGSGEIGMVSTGLMMERLLDLSRQAPWIALGTLLALFLLLAIIWYRNKSQSVNKGVFAYILAVMVQLILTVIVVAKHPGLIYLLAAAAILPPLIGAELEFVDGIKPITPVLLAGFSLIILTFFARAWIVSLNDHNHNVLSLAQSQQAIESRLRKLSAELGKPRSDLEILSTYGVYNGCFARWFGNDYGASALSTYIHKICPQDGSLNIFNGYVNTGSRSVPLSESDWDVILIRSNLFTGRALEFGVNYRVEESTIQFPGNYGPVLFITPIR
jgi:hypothetical protein